MLKEVINDEIKDSIAHIAHSKFHRVTLVIKYVFQNCNTEYRFVD